MLSIPTFVIDNPFGTIKSFVEYDVKYKMFEKYPMECNTDFCRNWLKSTVKKFLKKNSKLFLNDWLNLYGISFRKKI
jgi:hypothetical protein